MIPIVDLAEPRWLSLAQQALEDLGVVSISNAVPDGLRQELPQAMGRLEKAIAHDLGPSYRQDNLRHNRRVEFQCPLRYEPYFYNFLELEATRQSVEALLGPWATLRSQTFEDRHGEQPDLVQVDWHMNFRVQGDGVKALDVIYVLDELNQATSCLELVLGSHRRKGRPNTEYMEWARRPFYCPAGSLVLMDARLWHREWAGTPTTRHLLIHQLFVPHWVKPFFDFPRLLGEEAVAARDPRTRRLLGFESRPPVSLQEFGLPPAERPYQAGQWEF